LTIWLGKKNRSCFLSPS